MKALKPNVCNRINKFETLSKLQENVCIFSYKKNYWFIYFIYAIHKESATLLLNLHFLLKRQLVTCSHVPNFRIRCIFCVPPYSLTMTVEYLAQQKREGSLGVWRSSLVKTLQFTQECFHISLVKSSSKSPLLWKVLICHMKHRLQNTDYMWSVMHDHCCVA